METNQIIEQALRVAQPGPFLSRRSLLRLCGATVAGLASWQFLGLGAAMSAPLIITEQAQGLVIADPTKCVACRRCELACTEFNDGKSSPTLSRIKVRRNINFGPAGLYTGQSTHGSWGTGLVIQDVCKQCAHPVPCADACPNGAIVVKPPINARIIDQAKCTGCGICRHACPWEMISFDPETNKATKCFLCDGKPKCVEACPAEALIYASWVDLTGKISPRVTTAHMNKPQSCVDCHK
ncbi:MAG: 4Fe-4S dicluster domain-containing protein [Syntrophobacteraceae bacterium]